MNPRVFLYSALIFLMIGAGLRAQTDRRKGPIVRQVDRILIESSNPKQLFEFFSRALQLPEAWPLAENQGHMSGGLGAGNVNIEFYRSAAVKGIPVGKIGNARYAALALEPYPLADAMREMRIGGIDFSPPEPSVSTLPNGTQGVLWTLVPLPSYSKPGMSIFLYEYSPAFLKVDIRRKQLGNRLTLNNGGPLGIQSVHEIVIAAVHYDREIKEWRRLLGEPASPAQWKIGPGPMLRLVRGPEDRIQELAFIVSSLESAKAFLKRNQWLGATTANEAFLKPATIQALRIRLINKSPL